MQRFGASRVDLAERHVQVRPVKLCVGRPRLWRIGRERSQELSEPIAGFQLWRENFGEIPDDLVAGRLDDLCDPRRIRTEALNDVAFDVVAPVHGSDLDSAYEPEPADPRIRV